MKIDRKRAYENSLMPFIFTKFSFAKELAYDLNKDGKIDRIEKFEGQKKVLIKEDRNNDGEFDHFTKLSNNQIFKLIEIDSNSDKKIDIIKTYSLTSDKKIKLTTRKDRNFDGEFEITDEKILHQHQENLEEYDCMITPIQTELDLIAKSSTIISGKANNGFIPTTYGFQIEDKCLEKWGTYFLRIAKEARKEGLQCLRKMAEKQRPNISAPLRNVFELTQLAKEKTISIVCNETSYSWGERTNAHASYKDSQRMEDYPNLSPPYMSLNPSHPESEKPYWADNTQFNPWLFSNFDYDKEVMKVKKTIFHEMFHNLGHLHGEDKEYAYPCSDCCIDAPTWRTSKEVKELSCRLCQDDYSENESEYHRDIIKYWDERGSKFLKDGVENAFIFIRDNLEKEEQIIPLLNFLKEKESSNAFIYAQALVHFSPNLTSSQLQALSAIKDKRSLETQIKSMTHTKIVLNGVKTIKDLGKDGDVLLNYVKDHKEQIISELGKRNDLEARSKKAALLSKLYGLSLAKLKSLPTGEGLKFNKEFKEFMEDFEKELNL